MGILWEEGGAAWDFKVRKLELSAKCLQWILPGPCLNTATVESVKGKDRVPVIKKNTR